MGEECAGWREGHEAGSESWGWQPGSPGEAVGGAGDSRMWAGASRHCAQQVGAPSPPPSLLVSPRAGSDTLTQKQTVRQKDPFDFVHRHGIGGALGRGPRKWLPGCGEEGSQLLPSDPGGCKREQWTESGGLAGGHAQRSSRVGGTEATTGEEVFSFAKITPLGPKWEVSRAGRFGEPHPQEGRHLKDSQGAMGQPYCWK